ncbi:hypothetical protein D039_0661A, partial [Vibrio parahaemolyticus EKP-028]
MLNTTQETNTLRP